jgi:hypothetical protein
MIGVPPTAGFISKLYLGIGGAQAGQFWVIAVLAGSSILNAAYFLPIIHRAYFRDAAGDAGDATMARWRRAGRAEAAGCCWRRRWRPLRWRSGPASSRPCLQSAGTGALIVTEVRP